MTRSHSDCFRNHSVDLKRRPPKSRPTAFPWRIASPPEGGPQGLRRPRFSFFRFTCQTARDDGSPNPSAGPRVVEATNFRLESEAVQPLKVRSFGGAPSRRHADGTPYSGYIRFDPCECQHVMVKNLTPRRCSMKWPFGALRRNGYAALRPHFWQHFHHWWMGKVSVRGYNACTVRVGRRFYPARARGRPLPVPLTGCCSGGIVLLLRSGPFVGCV